MSEISRYPLAWPLGWKRSGDNKTSRFTSFGRALTMSGAVDRLSAELDRLGAADPVLSTNMRIGMRGDPLAGQAEPKDRGIAVYFKLNTKDRVLACDVYATVAGNIAAVAAHIDALRRIERYGVGTMEQAFAGYDALPPPSVDNRPAWRGILGFRPEAEVTVDDVRVNYRALAKASIGNDERLAALNMARDAAIRELGGVV